MILEQLLVVGQIIALGVSSLFLLSIIIRRNDIADIAWGMGIALVAFLSYESLGEPTPLQTLLLFLAVLWGARLSARIFSRNIKKPEDYRYKAWRDEWGKWFYPRSYLQVYLLQGFLMIVVGYSFIHASVYGGAGQLTPFAFLGLFVWAIGFFFEAVADWQLDRFIAQKPAPGSVLTTGLWKYSRHPNYFGEVTMWWGIWLIVAPLPLSYLALISPITITFLILKVSGIPLLEAKYDGNAEYAAYKAKTSAFFPLPPKR